MQCLKDRGCWSEMRPELPFEVQNCRLLQETKSNFDSAYAEITAMHDCARELKPDGTWTKSCSPDLEKQILLEVRESMGKVSQGLNNISQLYKRTTFKTEGAPISKLYAQPTAPMASAPLDADGGLRQMASLMGSACDDLERKQSQCSVNLEEAGGSKPVGQRWLVLSLHIVDAILAVGLVTILFYSAVMLASGQSTETSAHNVASVQSPETPQDESECLVGVGCEGGRGGRHSDRRVLVLVVFVLIAALVHLAIKRLVPTQALGSQTLATSDHLACEHSLQQAFDMCQDLFATLSGAADGDEATDTTLETVVSQLAQDLKDLASTIIGQSPW